MKKNSIAIIGWWAAGMMVAATLAQRKQESDRDGQVLLFEKNKSLGAKVIISWWWRCNLTTGFTKRNELQSKYTRGREFFDPSLKKFTPRSVKKRFESIWVPCKIEDDMRVFPISNDGKDVVKAFEQVLKEGATDIHFQEWVDGISKSSTWYIIQTGKWTYEVEKVVLTTWGNAYQHTGSSWDWYDFATSLWHTITPLWPSLNSFVTQQKRIHSLSGLSFPDATIHLQDKSNHSWPILLTHFGISGPLTFIAASNTAFEEVSAESPLSLRVQPLSEMNYDSRNEYLLSESQTSKKELLTTLAHWLPKRFCEGLLAECELQSHKPISQLSKKDRLRLADQLGNWIPLSLIQRRPGDEFVTAWWVNTDEIDPETLESTICPWLYFAWEILNVDGITWGYNLQMCWSTGRSLGMGL